MINKKYKKKIKIQKNTYFIENKLKYDFCFFNYECSDERILVLPCCVLLFYFYFFRLGKTIHLDIVFHE